MQCWRIHSPSRGWGFSSWVREIPWRKKWQPTPEFSPRKSCGRRSLVGHSPRGCEELDTTERLHKTTTISPPKEEPVGPIRGVQRVRPSLWVGVELGEDVRKPPVPSPTLGLGGWDYIPCTLSPPNITPPFVNKQGHNNPSIQSSHSVMSDSLQPYGLQHTRLPCPSPTPGACWNSPPPSQRCHPTISSSVTTFSFCPQSFPGYFPKSWLIASGGQSIGSSASASVLPVNIQGWFHLGFNGLISLLSKGLPGVFSNTTVQKHQFFSIQCSFGPTLTSIHDY